MAELSLEQRKAIAIARARLRSQQKPERSGWDLPVQGMSGVNEGIADMLGAPVDLVTGAINTGAKGINAVAGTDFKGIEKPFGGSEHIRGLMAPTVSEQQPQTTAERYARRIGREAGAVAVPGLAMMGKAQKPLALAGGLASEAIGAGAAGQVTEDMGLPAPVQMAASLAGGLAAPGAAYMARKAPPAPSLDDLRAQRDAAYAKADASGAQIDPDARDYLVDAIRSRLQRERLHPRQHPKASTQIDAMDQYLPKSPRIRDVEQERQLWGSDVAGSPDAGERRLGVSAKEEIDNFLDQLSPGLMRGGNPDEAVDALKTGRERAHRVFKAELLEGEDVGLLDKARRRAATSGTGGNELNAIRQNIARVLADPKKRRQYSEAERALMREIADGTPSDNALRWLGRSLSPTTGALQGLGNLLMTGQGIASGNPLWLAPGVAGLGAKGVSEARLNKRVDQLVEMIRRGGPAPKKTVSDTERRLIAALLASQTAGAAGPTQ